MASGNNSGAKKKSNNGSKTSAKSQRSSKRSTSGSSTANSSARGTGTKRQSSDVALIVIMMLIVSGIFLYLFLSVLGFGGNLGNLIRFVLRGLFGVLSYVFPIAMLALVLALFFYPDLEVLPNILGGILLFITLCVLFSAFSYGNSPQPLGACYLEGSSLQNLGGALGGCILNLLEPAISLVAVYVIHVILLLIGLILVTGFNLSDFVYELAQDHQANRDSEKIRRELEREAKKEVRQKQRDEQRKQAAIDAERNIRLQEEADTLNRRNQNRSSVYSGVGLDMTVGPSDDANSAGNMKEIHPAGPLEPQEAAPAAKTGSKKKASSKRSASNEDTNKTMDLTGTAPEAQDPVQLSIDDYFPKGMEGIVSAETYPYDRTAAEPASQPEAAVGVRKRRTYESAADKQHGIDDVQRIVNKDKASGNGKEYFFPDIDWLARGKGSGNPQTKAEQNAATAAKLERTLHEFNVDATVTGISCGPAVTRFEITPAIGVKVNKIVSLTNDLKLSLAAADIRIEAPIPGKSAVGIEVPNAESTTVSFRDLIESPEYENSASPLTFAVGMDISGKVKVADIAKMPHLLIAGATGSGKSVCINTIIMSILYKARPDEVKMIMIDPKVVELSVYNGIPHLAIPVVTDPKKAAGALNWAVQEMTRRYNEFAETGVRDIKGYNAFVERELAQREEQKRLSEQEALASQGADAESADPEKANSSEAAAQSEEKVREKMPLFVIIVDELADLMMVASKDVEESICRLAQLARAAGIHLIIATQRPSVNVITGLIKANMPSRIAFAVTSGVDSRTILDMNGAEKLLGKGDMLFDPQGAPKPMRVQGAFISDDEVQNIINDIKDKNGPYKVSEELQKQVNSCQSPSASMASTEEEEGLYDPLFADAGKVITDKSKASIGMLQRYLKIGFNRAARIMDQLEEAGVVGPEEGTKPRAVLMSLEQFENYLEQNG